MSACLYVGVHVYMCEHTCVCVCVCIHMCASTHVCIHVCVCVCAYVCSCACACVCLYTCVHVCVVAMCVSIEHLFKENKVLHTLYMIICTGLGNLCKAACSRHRSAYFER